MNELLGATVSGEATECNGHRAGQTTSNHPTKAAESVGRRVTGADGANAKTLGWLPVADDRNGTMTFGEAIVADSQRREREKNECGQLHFAHGSKSDDATATAFGPRLTLELSRAAKRLRLE